MPTESELKHPKVKISLTKKDIELLTTKDMSIYEWIKSKFNDL